MTRKFLYGLVTLLLGFLIHVVFDRLFAGFGFRFHFLLLIVVAHGFRMGALMGETMGFLWGLLVDAVGIYYFGLETLLYSVAGYVAGKLRRRVASERQPAQMFVGFAVSVYYFLGLYAVRSFFGEAVDGPSWFGTIFSIMINVVLTPAIFWLVGFWIDRWALHQEYID